MNDLPTTVFVCVVAALVGALIGSVEADKTTLRLCAVHGQATLHGLVKIKCEVIKEPT